MFTRTPLRSLLVILVVTTIFVLSPQGANGQNSRRQEFVPQELVVKFKAGTSETVRTDIRRGAGAQLLRRFSADSRLEHLRIPASDNLDSALAYFATRADVQYVQKNFIYHITDTVPNDPLFFEQYGWWNQLVRASPLASVNATAAWDKSTGRFSVIVADIDTGVDYTHPDLGLNIWTNPGEAGVKCSDGVDNDGDGFADDCRGWNFWSITNDPMDDNGHGTHIAGTLGALTNNGLGVAGANWDVQIMPLKFTNAQGTGTTALAVQALDYAVAHGATVANFSSGFYGSSASGFDFAFRDAIKRADAAGVLFVTAAGNGANGGDGTDDDTTPFYPCSFSQADAVNNPIPPANILCVTATDSLDNLPEFANYGPATVQLGAPGVGITSTWLWSTSPYAGTTGTSEAAPHVAGGVALLKGCNPSLSGATIKTILLDTVRHDDALAGLTTEGGVVDYQAAINDPRVGVCAPPLTGSAPKADAGGPYDSNMKKPVQFNGNTSSDKGGQLLIYFWSFGDGTYGVGPKVTHTYSVASVYPVVLTVRDDHGAVSSQSTTVNVHGTGQTTSLGSPGPH